MKNQLLDIALEGTRSGDVVGGLTVTGENLQALLFWKGGTYGRESQTKNKRQGEPLVGVDIPQWEKDIPKGGR